MTDSNETIVEDKPVKLSARDKAAVTNREAWSIIDAEASARDTKTEKLRALRLEREKAELSEPKPAPARRRAAKK
ncbi:hypothetical protein [Pararhizobium arenae]|uniref:hypothetical protein n=1 Tax=Pararhizobium arenae TaxID=1856850 RepID=UPI000AEDFE54|nr:hypothetical protein [Pararhizobium arenae]